jgi:hypothetical protein
MRKVNLQVIRPWIVKKVVELVGFEDEVVVEYAVGLLDDKSKPVRGLHPLSVLPSRSSRYPTQDSYKST